MKEYNLTSARRGFIKGLLFTGAACMLFNPASILAQDAKAPQKKKPLIAYFTQSGNTQALARQLQKQIGGDLVLIETVEPYPADYDTLTKVAKQEQQDNARPAIKTKIDNIDQYGDIFLGYPNWWSSMPMPVVTFVEQNKLDGKTIAPFITHGGGGAGHSVEDLKKLVPHAKVLPPLVVRGTQASHAEEDIKRWLEGLGTALIYTTTGDQAIYPDGGY